MVIVVSTTLCQRVLVGACRLVHALHWPCASMIEATSVDTSLLYVCTQVVLAVALTTRGMAGLRPAGDAVVLEYDMNNGGPRPPLKVQGAQLVRQADGKAIEIHGVNW